MSAANPDTPNPRGDAYFESTDSPLIIDDGPGDTTRRPAPYQVAPNWRPRLPGQTQSPQSEKQEEPPTSKS
jgi:hypothetical protein